jgi:hypothetical protein
MKVKLKTVLPMFLFYLKYLFILYFFRTWLTIMLEGASKSLRRGMIQKRLGNTDLGCSRYWPWTWWNKGEHKELHDEGPVTSNMDCQDRLTLHTVLQGVSTETGHLWLQPLFSPQSTWGQSRVYSVDINTKCSHDLHNTNFCWRRRRWSPKRCTPTPHWHGWLPKKTSLYNTQQIALYRQNNNQIQKLSLLTQLMNVGNDSNHMQKLLS